MKIRTSSFHIGSGVFCLALMGAVVLHPWKHAHDECLKSKQAQRVEANSNVLAHVLPNKAAKDAALVFDYIILRPIFTFRDYYSCAENCSK